MVLHGDVLVSSSLNDSVTVFRRDLGGAGAWGVEAVIQRGELEMFGNSIDLGDDLLVVGAEDVVSVYDARAAWTPLAELRPPLADMTGDNFGDGALQTVGNEVVVGVPGDDFAGANSGSALVYVPGAVDPIAEIIGSCPGEITLSVTGGTPRGQGQLWVGSAIGDDPLPGGFCEGVPLGLEEPAPLFSFRFDGIGAWERTQTLGDGACGRPIQVLDRTGCAVTDVVLVP